VSAGLALAAPDRLAGFTICRSSCRGFETMVPDARRHASPEAVWTEAGTAGALRVRLGGPVTWDGIAESRPSFEQDASPPKAAALAASLRTRGRSRVILWSGLGALAWAV
jgi:adenosylcobinamide-phosphate synthase